MHHEGCVNWEGGGNLLMRYDMGNMESGMNPHGRWEFEPDY